ncbi:cell division cycle protein 91 [Coprinopsis cinerea okayama7|uniref:Cell division cycle protein 91 n=1 Tax=Coprinopsis cinerea (strain Okayama-7 / 130 / ATCC MYA-4618 / FGSC 9003) TaxID=240176 RepID=A8N7A6_COPC7|nr:cell division cycle protein 91 [Coprinopsis cinerea okayama7\|eukprot:XP_001830712.2 cell division cycle protein 91 [Coprinopsis cinerea okayama7\
MSSSQRLLSFNVVVPALLATKLAFGFSKLPDAVRYDHQLSSPLTSFSQLQEGLWLFNHGIDPYAGGTFRHSPLLLALFSTILPSSRSFAPIIWVLFDALAAWALVNIWRARQNVPASTRDGIIAALYLANPYIFLPSLALSTSTIENALMLLSVMFASQHKSSASLLTLAFLTQLSPISILVLAPLLLLLITDPHSHLASPKPLTASLKRTLPYLGEFLLYTGALAFAATLVTGDWNWVSQTWGTWITLPDLTPNPGLWWYFFTEMFDHFRPFFLMVFTVHLVIYVAPLCIKFQHDPLFALFLLLGVLGTFKAYPTLSDPGLFLSIMSIFPELFPYMRHPIVTGLLHLHAALLLPLFNHLWLIQGTGNANFFYASTLVFACANGMAVIDCLWAGMRIAIGKEVEGYSVIQDK